MEVLSRSKPIAKKEHRCGCCGGIIKVGEKYANQAIHDTGRVDNFRSHFHCKSLTDMLNMWDNCDEDGLGSDSFQENVYEYICENHDKETIQIERNLPFPELAKKVYNELK